jgi:hypothetical protein
MKTKSGKLLLWSPRILAILVCLFLSVFAFDALGNGKTLAEAFPDFALHVAPVLVLLAVAGAAWRWEWIGGLVFTGIAAGYAYFARDHASWILYISAPLLIVGVLFFWSWLRQRELRASS